MSGMYSPKHAVNTMPRFTPVEATLTRYDMPVIRKTDEIKYVVKHAIKSSWKRFTANDELVIGAVIVGMAVVSAVVAILA